MDTRHKVESCLFAAFAAIGAFAAEPAAKATVTGGYAYLTDEARSFTQVPLIPCADGSAVFFMQPLSFAYVEL